MSSLSEICKELDLMPYDPNDPDEAECIKNGYGYVDSTRNYPVFRFRPGAGEPQTCNTAVSDSQPPGFKQKNQLDETDLLKLRILETVLYGNVNGHRSIMTWKRFKQEVGFDDKIKLVVEDLLKKGYLNADEKFVWITLEGYILLTDLQRLAGLK